VHREALDGTQEREHREPVGRRRSTALTMVRADPSIMADRKKETI
jgi:hypothetical protein